MLLIMNLKIHYGFNILKLLKMSRFLLVNGDVKREIILSDQLKQTLKNLFDELNIDEEKDIRIIKSLLSHKFNLKSTVYREDKILNAMLSEIFNKDVVDKIFKAKMREYQRNRYKHKEVKNYARKYEVKREVISDQLLIQ